MRTFVPPHRGTPLRQGEGTPPHGEFPTLPPPLSRPRIPAGRARSEIP